MPIVFGVGPVGIVLSTIAHDLPHEVGSGSDITPCIRTDKPLVV